MRFLLAIAAALALAGCASDGYYTAGYAGGYGTYGQPYYTPSYGNSTYYYDYATPYSYGTPYYYGTPYGYPGVGANIYYYDRDGRYDRNDRRHDGRHRDRDGDGRADWRDRDDRQPNWRGPAPRGHVGDADPAEGLPNWRDRDGDGRFDPGEEVHRGPRHPGSEGR